MFVEVVQGRASDPEALRAAMDRWTRELAPDASGWLGSTGGITDDGRFIAVARFESADAAARNSQRPEQARWWADFERLLAGDLTIRDSEDVTVDLTGDPEQAGFVQVMQGRVTDLDRARELMQQVPSEVMAYRPDVLGSVRVGHEDGEWTQVIYFTSETAARDGERTEPPREVQAVREEMTTLSVGEPAFFDLRRPVLQSPG
jgi:hypothetical protein